MYVSWSWSYIIIIFVFSTSMLDPSYKCYFLHCDQWPSQVAAANHSEKVQWMEDIAETVQVFITIIFYPHHSHHNLNFVENIFLLIPVSFLLHNDHSMHNYYNDHNYHSMHGNGALIRHRRQTSMLPIFCQYFLQLFCPWLHNWQLFCQLSFYMIIL